MEVAYSAVADPPTGVEMHSALDDPYPAARDDVRDALQKLQRMHEEWNRLLRTNTAESERFQFLHAKIAEEVQGIGEDLEGIGLAIKAVEDNRKSFPVDDAEMSRRRDFLRTSEATLKDIRAYVTKPQTIAKLEADQRETKAAKAAESTRQEAKQAKQAAAGVGGLGVDDDFLNNEDFLGSTRFQQQQIRQEQDDYMLDIGKSAARLKDAAVTMNTEINYQNVLLDQIDEDIERETENLNSVMKHVGRLLQTSDHTQLYVIIILSMLFAILLFMVFV